MTAIVVIMIVLGYAVMIGFTYQFIYTRVTGYDKEFPSGIGGILWPVILPIALGRKFARSVDPGSRATRDERRRRNEMEQARHEEQLAQARLREAQLTEEAIAIAQGRQPEKKQREVEFGRWD